jgi:hypothetical protein
MYVPDKPPDEQAARTWLLSGGEAAIAALELKAGERVSVFEDGVTADLLREPSPTVAAARIESVAAFARAIPELRPHPPRQLLPAAFADLQALADQWAIPDDAMRSDAIEGSSSEEIDTLIVAVAPRLPEIQAELDSATEPLSDAQLRLQLLAEATAEAQEAISARSLLNRARDDSE